jgi:hypothetical protein
MQFEDFPIHNPAHPQPTCWLNWLTNVVLSSLSRTPLEKPYVPPAANLPLSSPYPPGRDSKGG